MPAVHRPMQRHGLGNAIPIKSRTCTQCQEIFKSQQGLRNHQSRKSNTACFRTGYLSKRKDWINGRLLHQKSWRNKKIQHVHRSVFEKHTTGKPFSKEVKQVCLNVFDYLLKGGTDKSLAIVKAAKMCGISQRSMGSFLKEKLCGELCDNNPKFKKYSTIYEKLSLVQIDRIRRLIHGIFAKIRKKEPEEYPSIEYIHRKLQNFGQFQGWSLPTTRQIVLALGFRFKKAHAINHAALVESPYIIECRKKYIKRIFEYRRAGRTIVVFDETYVNSNHSPDRVLTDTTVKSAKDAEERGLTTGVYFV